MEGYLGETIVDVKDTDFSGYTTDDWAMYFIERYGQIDGAHHKQWVLDQVAQVLKGTKVIISLAKWDNGESEYRIILDNPSSEYLSWVEYMKLDENGEIEYTYDDGIAP